ncbi:arylamine N-acetyltransferase family protein [Streptomyces sp. enrichment culture]|uniref:arylamine N-acetyltransferase family protein n=1 Tax=Streptomyces sp. enrichment culture TaxID=1795815 RepID=UPI003F558AE5
MSENTEFDLDAYLRRIGWEGPRRPDLETLRGIHLAHILSIPFENLDPLAGRVPSLEPADVVAKLVHGERGGYCYEHNSLFWAALRALGFEARGLAGRVLVGAEYGRGRPRTHMALLVRVPGEETPYLADVGFGSDGSLLEAVPLVRDTEFRSGPRRHRLVFGPDVNPSPTWVLQAYQNGGWSDQYAFTLDVFELGDYEVFNWYVGGHPRSPFTKRAYAQHTTAEGHVLLFGSVLTESTAEGVTERTLTDEQEARRVLKERFGIAAPEDVTLLS